MDDLQPGDPRLIGPYWLKGRLGSGGMGQVYLARSPGGRHVAFKVIRGPVPWLATSYVAGPSLDRAVAEVGPLPVGSVLTLAAGLAEGLKAIHSAGVVHRDLKPSNVILADDGPRLIDFGISRSAEMSALTRTGVVMGSPGFMSPEQAEGGEVGPASDIFSLGAVLAFAATGEGPFGEGSTPALVYRVVFSAPHTANLPDQVRPLVERCLAKDPARRPTAASLLAELSGGEPTAFEAAPILQRSAARGLPGPPGGGVPLDTSQPLHPATERAADQEPWPGTTWPDSTWPGNTPTGHPTVTTPGGRFLHDGPPEQPPPVLPPTAQPEGHRRSRRGWLIAVTAVAVLIAAAAVAFLAGHLSSRAPSTSSGSPRGSSSSSPAGGRSSAATSPSSPAPLPGASTMAALGSYLSQSASVRPTVQPAIDSVLNCSQSPASGRATLQQAIDTRQRILQGLQTLSPAGLPNGAQMIGVLITAMQKSIEADQDYQRWMTDVENSPSASCGQDPNQDPNFAAGQSASAEATTAKRAFVDLWNPMAPRYGQSTYSSTDF